MKITFTRTTKPAYGGCQQCDHVFALGDEWYYNWRPNAVVKRLCPTCYMKRVIQRDWARDLATPPKRYS